MISFKHSGQRLNIWLKKSGFIIQRIQPMDYTRKDISLTEFYRELSNVNIMMNKENRNGMRSEITTQEIRQNDIEFCVLHS